MTKFITPRRRFDLRAALTLSVCASAVLATGCATSRTSNTSRTASEQVLISAAIDRSLSNVRFGDFAGHAVFVDDKYLDATDKGYLVGSIRHRILESGGRIAGSADAADLVLEPRSGGVGTDSEETYIGTPAIGVPGMPFELPEIKLVSRSTQIGTAKVGMVCYDPKTGAALGAGGQSMALTHNADTYVFGVGPFRSGEVKDAREQSVGFKGVGGSITGSDKIARSRPVSLVTPTAKDGFTSFPQIATGTLNTETK